MDGQSQDVVRRSRQPVTDTTWSTHDNLCHNEVWLVRRGRYLVSHPQTEMCDEENDEKTVLPV